MYYCPDCGYEFQTAQRLSETHGFASPPFEDIYVCPNCNGGNYYEKISTHCRCCGARLFESGRDYCSDDCRINGEKLWKREQRRRKLNSRNPLSEIVREVDAYNLRNRTNYSYGQYVALVRPRLKRGRRI